MNIHIKQRKQLFKEYFTEWLPRRFRLMLAEPIGIFMMAVCNLYLVPLFFIMAAGELVLRILPLNKWLVEMEKEDET